MTPLDNPFYGSETALRVQVGCLLDHLRLVIEATRGTVAPAHTLSLENCFEILESVSNELENEGAKQSND